MLVLTVMVMMMMMCCSSVSGKDKDKTTASTAEMVHCWECMNYDTKGKFYDQCPLNDSVDPSRAYLGNCTGKCFTHTDDLDDKLIVRGCTGSQWGLPNPLPEDGCYPWYSEIWCVCSTDGCNGVKLGTPTSDTEFDAHIDYSRPGGQDNSADPLGGSPTSLLCSAVVLVITFLSTSMLILLE